MKIALVTFTEPGHDGKPMAPVAFRDTAYAIGSWRLSYSKIGGITFTEYKDRTDIFHNGKKVGEVREIELYESVEHL